MVGVVGQAAVVAARKVTAEHRVAAEADQATFAAEQKVQFVRRQGIRPLVQPALVPGRWIGAQQTVWTVWCFSWGALCFFFVLSS